MALQRVVVVGSGNLAEALAQAVAQSGAQLVQLFARNRERGPAVARLAGAPWSDDPQQLAVADLYLLAVSDRAVAEVAEGLPIPAGAAVVHTAGSVAMDALPARYARRGVLYPLQTFTAGRAVDFRRIPLFVEASTPVLQEELEAFAARLSQAVHRLDSQQRVWLHLAGVFACNFVNAMYAAGEGIVQRAGVGFEVLKPLLAETAAKAAAAASPRTVQTGPAVRHDTATQARHEALLAGDPQLQAIYRLISNEIWETSKKI